MIDFREIEKKWQKKWEEEGIFRSNLDPKKKKFYVLEMLPYTSGKGIHMGHARNYFIGDAFARFKRMKGFNVLYPMGFDAFGLPAENAAIKNKTHPKIYTENAIKNMTKQLKSLGLSYDWSRTIATCYLKYYKWNQWLFLKFFERGLVYRRKAPINWCPKCGTVLANEQVHEGRCWRCKSRVEIKHLEQWFLKITDYAEELLQSLDKLSGWPEKIISMQRNWIGKSSGTEIYFKIEETNDIIPIFTTRPDTLFGVTFIVFAPEHPKVMELVKGTKYENKVKKFIQRFVIEDRFERTSEDTEKKGMFIGKYAINPINNDRIPIYIGNFVLLEYGSGAVMGVPAHDQRDFEFAKKYKIPFKIVITPEENELKELKKAYVDEGVLINSGIFNGMKSLEAKEKITKYLEKKKLGKASVQYKLRDWLISRQRYWGTPIPIVYCDRCGVVPEENIPVVLPEDVEFTGKGNPLNTSEKFIKTKCPRCGGEGRRETDTMDTFFDSSWYFLRYCSPNEEKAPFSKKMVDYWMPVDQYIGGAEHAVMHLLYARFFCKVLRDLNLVKFDEPFTRLFNQGTIYKDGAKMSKSKGNVVDPMKIVEKYGSDALRLFLLFVASPDKQLEWSDRGIKDSFRFLSKTYLLKDLKPGNGKKDKFIISRREKTIKSVTKTIEELKFNLAIKNVMEFVGSIYKYKDQISEKVHKENLKKFALISSPFAPHLSEEIWRKTGNKNFVSTAEWPEADESKIDEEAELEECLVRTIRNDVEEIKKIIKIKKPEKIKLFIAPEWKYEIYEKIEEGNSLNDIMKDKKYKKLGNEAVRYAQTLIKKRRKILKREKEIEILQEEKEFFEKETEAKIEIVKDGTEHSKVKQARPMKPGILIE